MKITGALVWVAFLGVVQAEPPKVSFPSGNMTVNHGKATVEFLPDGSVKVSSPLINLVIPGSGVQPGPRPNPDNPLPDPKPPVPANEFAETVKSMFGADLDANKVAKLGKLKEYWAAALTMIEGSSTLGELTGKMRALPVLPESDLRPIREFFRDAMRDQLGKKTTDPLDSAKARALFGQFISALEACQ